MWLGRKETLNKTEVRVYVLTLKCLTLPLQFSISLQIIRLGLLLVILFVSINYERFCAYPHPPSTIRLLSTSSILRKSDTRTPIPSVVCLGRTISIHYIASLLSSQVYFSEVDGYSYRFSDGGLREVCRRCRDW